MKLIEIVSNDYYASSNEHVFIPEGMDLNEEKSAYGDWYQHVYLSKNPKYMSFAEYLVTKGARWPEDHELKTFQE